MEDIIEKEFPDGVKNCYKLQPIYQSCAIFTPVDNNAVFMRPIMSRDEANRLIAEIGEIPPCEVRAVSPREMSSEYDRIIKNHDCTSLVALAKYIYKKRIRLLEAKKKLSAVDERYMKKAEDLLFGELAASLGIEKTEIRENVVIEV